MSEPATFCGMYATALDLPPEIITRIVELLAGEWPETWEADSCTVSPPLKLSKREFANCSLVCKYWAGHLRQDIFYRLTLKTPEDGRIFRSFIDQSVCPQSSIKNLVQHLDIKYDLADPPWVQHVFMFCIPKLRKSYTLPVVNVEMSDSSKTPSSLPLRSIYPFLPRPLPPRITNIRTLCLRNLEFANFQDLGKLIGSVGNLSRVKLWNVLVKDTEILYSCRPLPPRIQERIAITVYGGNISLRLLRLVLPIGDRRSNPHFGIPPGVILTLEQTISSIIHFDKPSLTNRDDILDYRMFSVEYNQSISPPHFYYDVSVEWNNQERVIYGVDVLLDETGSYLSLQVGDIVSTGEMNLVRWAQLDKDLSLFFPKLHSITVQVIEEFELEDLDKLTNILSREMTNCVQAEKLFIYADYKTYCVLPYGEDDEDDDEEDNEEDDEEDDEEAEAEKKTKPAYRNDTREKDDHGQYVWLKKPRLSCNRTPCICKSMS